MRSIKEHNTVCKSALHKIFLKATSKCLEVHFSRSVCAPLYVCTAYIAELYRPTPPQFTDYRCVPDLQSHNITLESMGLLCLGALVDARDLSGKVMNCEISLADPQSNIRT